MSVGIPGCLHANESEVMTTYAEAQMHDVVRPVPIVRADWYESTTELGELLIYLTDQCSDRDERARVTREVCEKPWKWTEEYRAMRGGKS